MGGGTPLPISLRRNELTKTKQTFTFAATGVDIAKRFDENGIIRIIVMKLPAFADNPTVTLTLRDEEDNIIWTDAGAPRADGTTYIIDSLVLPVDHGFSMNVHLSANAGAGGGIATVKSLIET